LRKVADAFQRSVGEDFLLRAPGVVKPSALPISSRGAAGLWDNCCRNHRRGRCSSNPANVRCRDRKFRLCVVQISSARYSPRVFPFSPIRAVALDLFHTVVDPEDFRPKDFVRTREIAKLLGLPLAEFERFWEEVTLARMTSERPSVVDRVRDYCSSIGVRPAPTSWSMVFDIAGRYTDLAIRNPRASVLDALRGLRAKGLALGLVSNCDEREMKAWASSILAPLFDATVFSCEVGAAKPSVEAYSALVPRWGRIPLSEAIFVGDGANNELVGARRAGFLHVVFDSEFVSANGLRSTEANDRIRRDADAEVTTLGAVESLIAAWRKSQ